jgi:hypothetical protein
VLNAKQEIIFAIQACQEKMLCEQDVLSSHRLTKQMNSNSLRSRDWNIFDVDQLMVTLGFEMSVSPVSLSRGWRVNKESVDAATAQLVGQPTH